MRLLLDEHHVPWQTAWEITQATMGYTNHTLLPEAMEKWPISLFEYVLPRHMQIIYDINHRFLQQVTPYGRATWRDCSVCRSSRKASRSKYVWPTWLWLGAIPSTV